ncbi:MAG: FAD-binding protein [Verrucomicrobiota bacterium]
MPNLHPYELDQPTTLEGWHQAFSVTNTGIYRQKSDLQIPTSVAAQLDQYKKKTLAIMELVKDAMAQGPGAEFRAYGSTWSLSPLPVSTGRQLETARSNRILRIPPSLHRAAFKRDHPDGSIYLVEGGCTLAVLNRFLFREGQSIMAAGTNNGQTVTGAASTGTHGGAFKFGSVHDSIMALHVVVGSDRHILLQPKSAPAVSSKVAKNLDAEVVEDDELFYAAQMGLGCFGIVRGVFLLTRPLFLLHGELTYFDYDSTLKTFLNSLDVSAIALPQTTPDLYHLGFVLNPNDGGNPHRVAIHTYYEEPYHDDYEPPEPKQGEGLTSGGLEVMSAVMPLLSIWPLSTLVRDQLNQQVSERYPAGKKITGTIFELFRSEANVGPTFASGVAVPLDRVSDAIDTIFGTYASFGKLLPILIEGRYIKQTKALLGTGQDPISCVIEVDSIQNDLIFEFMDQVCANLEQNGIPFRPHWGKFNRCLIEPQDPGRLMRKQWGTKVDRWIAARKTVFPDPQLRHLFTNEFIRQVGLGD